MDYSEKVNELFSAQLREWDLAGTNYALLSKVRNRRLPMDDFEITVQFNPERIRSSAARVDSRSIEERPCFLCYPNRPVAQRSLRFPGDLEILINPFPIFNRHLTIASVDHKPQRISPGFDSMLDLAEALPEYVIFYNGPECGASAPDHFHFQAGSRRLLPVEYDSSSRRFTPTFCGQKGLEVWHWYGYLRGMVTFEGSDRKKIADHFRMLYSRMDSLQPGKPEPMMNILAYFIFGRWIVHIIPRKLHRPSQFFAEGEGRILLSPASVDLGGVIITPREEDFNKISPDDIKDIFRQVCLSDKEVMNLFV